MLNGQEGLKHCEVMKPAAMPSCLGGEDKGQTPITFGANRFVEVRILLSQLFFQLKLIINVFALVISFFFTTTPIQRPIAFRRAQSPLLHFDLRFPTEPKATYHNKALLFVLQLLGENQPGEVARAFL